MSPSCRRSLRKRADIRKGMLSAPACAVEDVTCRSSARTIIEAYGILRTFDKFGNVGSQISSLTACGVFRYRRRSEYIRSVFLFCDAVISAVSIPFEICARERTVDDILHSRTVFVRTRYFKFVDKISAVRSDPYPTDIRLPSNGGKFVIIRLPFRIGRARGAVHGRGVPNSLTRRSDVIETDTHSIRRAARCVFIFERQIIRLSVRQDTENGFIYVVMIEFQRFSVSVGTIRREIYAAEYGHGSGIFARAVVSYADHLKNIGINARIGSFERNVVNVEIAYAVRAYFQNKRFRGSGRFIRESRFRPVLSSSVNGIQNGEFVADNASVRALLFDFEINFIVGSLRAKAFYESADNVVLIGLNVECIGIHYEFAVRLVSFKM